MIIQVYTIVYYKDLHKESLTYPKTSTSSNRNFLLGVIFVCHALHVPHLIYLN